MRYVLLMMFCLDGLCVEYKPEGHYVVFSDVGKCREVVKAIRIRVTEQGVGTNGLCILGVKAPPAESEGQS